MTKSNTTNKTRGVPDPRYFRGRMWDCSICVQRLKKEKKRKERKKEAGCGGGGAPRYQQMQDSFRAVFEFQWDPITKANHTKKKTMMWWVSSQGHENYRKRTRVMFKKKKKKTKKRKRKEKGISQTHWGYSKRHICVKTVWEALQPTGARARSRPRGDFNTRD